MASRVNALAAVAWLLAWACASSADVFATRGADGSVSFTDAPTTPGYALIIREEPPQLPWKETAHREARDRGLDPRLVRAVIHVESGENPAAISPKGAMGLMQLMPETARELGVQDPMHPRENIRGGVTYLASLIERFGGRLDLALAAYNAGPGAVERHGGIPPYPETQNFVKKVLGIYERLGGEGG